VILKVLSQERLVRRILLLCALRRPIYRFGSAYTGNRRISFSYHSYLLPLLVSCASELIAVKVNSAYYWVMHVQLESVTSPGAVVSI
jgi:hypothetical protein